jgi:hypothetical protein
VATALSKVTVVEAVLKMVLLGLTLLGAAVSPWLSVVVTLLGTAEASGTLVVTLLGTTVAPGPAVPWDT